MTSWCGHCFSWFTDKGMRYRKIKWPLDTQPVSDRIEDGTACSSSCVPALSPRCTASRCMNWTSSHFPNNAHAMKQRFTILHQPLPADLLMSVSFSPVAQRGWSLGKVSDCCRQQLFLQLKGMQSQTRVTGSAHGHIYGSTERKQPLSSIPFPYAVLGYRKFQLLFFSQLGEISVS